MAGGLAAAGHASGLGWPFYASAAAAGAHMMWQIHTVDLDNGADCSAKFRSNAGLGAVVFGGIVAGQLAGAAPLPIV